MDIEELIKILGGFGRYQLRRYILLLMFAIYDGLETLAMIFVAAESDFECNIDQLNHTEGIWNLTKSDFRNLTIDPENSCRIYNESIAVFAMDSEAGNISAARKFLSNYSSMECPYGYNFLPSEYARSVVSDFELVCGKEILRSIAQACYFVGKLVGFSVTGRLADRYGRKKTFIVCVLVTSAFGVAAAAAPNIYVFYTCVTLYGSLGAYSVAFTLVMELVGVKHRLALGIGVHTAFAVGYILLSPLAYLIQNWRYLLVAINAPCVLFIAYLWYLDESLRWLLVKQKDEEVSSLLKKIAKENKKNLPENLEVQLREGLLQKEKHQENKSVLAFFKNKRMTLLTLIIWYIWIVNAMVYYGLSFNSSNLAGSMYINLALSAAVEIPAYAACTLLTNRMGRKKLLMISMFFSGVSCILAGVIEDRLSAVVFSLVGKFAITASFAIIWTYTAEFYPTNYRSIELCKYGYHWSRLSKPIPVMPVVAWFGLTMTRKILMLWFNRTLQIWISLEPAELAGFCDAQVCMVLLTMTRNLAVAGSSMISKFGSIAAPFIVQLHSIWKPLPVIVFGTVGLVATALSLFLPETTGRPLPQTINEMLENHRKSDRVLEKEISTKTTSLL